MQREIHLLYGTDAPYRLKDVLRQVNLQKAVLLDVRETDEWMENHLAKAELLPLSELKAGRLPDSEWLDKPLFLHCRSGLRVWAAEMILRNHGFTQTVALQEGVDELAAQGF